MTPKKPVRRKRRVIDPRLKREAIQRVLAGEVGAIVAREIDVRADLLYRWVRLQRKAAHAHPTSDRGVITNHEIDRLIEERIASLSTARENLERAREIEAEIRAGLK